MFVQDSPATEPWGVEMAAAMNASVAPMDMPTSAAESAARSLIPSPQNMVVFPRPYANKIMVPTAGCLHTCAIHIQVTTHKQTTFGVAQQARAGWASSKTIISMHSWEHDILWVLMTTS